MKMFLFPSSLLRSARTVELQASPQKNRNNLMIMDFARKVILSACSVPKIVVHLAR